MYSFNNSAASSFSANSINGIDFAIYGGSGSSSNSGEIVVFMDEDNTWQRISVSYFANTRTDIVAGAFSAGVYLQQKNSQSGQITLA